ncbi:unnamed protein product, partial [Rotaria sp. Silwood2]
MTSALSQLLGNYFFKSFASIKLIEQIITGLFYVRDVNLTQLALVVQGAGNDNSRYRKLQRFFSGFSFCYTALAKLLVAFAKIESEKWLLALDRTNWKFGKLDINILVLSICHNGIAIPIMWDMLPKTGASNSGERQKLIGRFLQVFGVEKISALLGDREFIGDDWLKFLADRNIPFYIRIKQNLTIGRSENELVTANPLVKKLQNNEYKVLRDLRRGKLHNNIMLRAKVIAHLRSLMAKNGFTEFQTPILTASSPEGARDFLVPSRLHPGKFYALPQAPQQFKQLLMVSGFDKYFQIAPCFRDEDARADRSPGEFYQLDIEMSFVTQEDIFNVIEPIMYEIFSKFSDKKISSIPFTRIPYDDAILKYGTDKPDLRNPIIITDVTELFKDTDFTIFKENIQNGSVIKAIPAPKASNLPRSFFDKMLDFANLEGAKGLGYIQFLEDGSSKGPIVKFLTNSQLLDLKTRANLQDGDAVFFASDQIEVATKFAGKLRTKLGEALGLLTKDSF